MTKRIVKSGAGIEERRLANGLRVLLVERHADPVVCVMLWYRVGSRDEREHEAGVSHFLEHMMFKGSAHFGKGEVDRWTTALGGSNNAFTNYDHTAYWFELASDRWEKALEIEADRMRGLLLEPDEFDAERAVVLEELSMGIDNPWQNLADRVSAALFERHAYRRPIIGYTDALKALSVEDMRAYHRRYYRPDNAFLVVCGDIDPDDAMARVERHFGAIEAGEAAEPRPELPVAIDADGAAGAEKRIEIRWDDQGKRLVVAWPGALVGSEDDYNLDVISSLLTNGRLSRLQRALVLDGALATSVSCHNDARVERGVFWVMAECAQGTTPAQLEDALFAEFERLANEPVPAAELKRVIAMLAAGEAYEDETVSDMAEQLGGFAIDADWRMAIHCTDELKKVTARRVRECAGRLLGRSGRVVGWCTPEQAEDESAAIERPVRARRAARKRSGSKARGKARGKSSR